jgi:hypothetical protein
LTVSAVVRVCATVGLAVTVSGEVAAVG